MLELLTGEGHDKHGDKWKDRSDRYNMSHAEVHKVRYFSEDYPDYDAETGVLHLTHYLANIQFVLERRLLRDLAKSAELDRGTDTDSPVPTSAENEMGGCG